MKDYVVVGSKGTHWRSGMEKWTGAVISSDLYHDGYENLLDDLYDGYVFYTIGGDDVEEDGENFFEYCSDFSDVMEFVAINSVDLDKWELRRLLNRDSTLTEEEVERFFLDSESNHEKIMSAEDNYEEITLYLSKDNAELIRWFALHLDSNEDKVQKLLNTLTIDDIVERLGKCLE